MADVINVHGARLSFPADWDDVSIYRFLPPPEPEADQGILTAKKPRRAQPNVVVTRHAQIDDDPPEKLFAVMNEKNAAENASYQVVESGEGEYLGQPIRWQDSTQTATEAGLRVTQRHVLLPGWDREFVLVTITGDKKQVASMCAAMGLDVQS